MTLRAAAGELSTLSRIIALAVMMVGVAASTAVMRPAPAGVAAAPDLEAIVPETFGEWRRAPISSVVLPAESEAGDGEASIYRAYRDRAGRLVTLVIAYGPPLGDSVRLHRPESCYVAQGYAIEKRSVASADIAGVDVRLVRLVTDHPTRDETVTYWLRAGDRFVTAPYSAQIFAILDGGIRTDGALVRVSSTGDDPYLAETHASFLRAFAGALDARGRAILFGAGAEAGA